MTYEKVARFLSHALRIVVVSALVVYVALLLTVEATTAEVRWLETGNADIIRAAACLGLLLAIAFWGCVRGSSEMLDGNGTPNIDPENARLLYQQACGAMTQYANMRFAQLTIFVALTGGILALLSDSTATHSGNMTLSLKILGLIVAASFWVMEERATTHWYHYNRKASLIAKRGSLGCDIHSGRPKGKLCGQANATNAARLLLLTALAFWALALASPNFLPGDGCLWSCSLGMGLPSP